METKTHSHLDTELLQLKKDMTEMWETVISQLQKAREVIRTNNRDLINEMAAGEKRIDAFELKIDMDCESLLALYGPVANDLRFVLASLKINYNLERIGDFAWGIAKVLRDMESAFSKDSIEKSNLFLMFDTVIDMTKTALLAFENDNNELASIIFDKDKVLDSNNKNANRIMAGLIKAHPKAVLNFLNLLTIIRKMERIGDHSKNIAEEIIFYVEAKVLRHQRKKNK
jgi:phosphate transport system protein